MRWVCQVPETTWAETASAASTSLRSIHVSPSRLTCLGLTCGASGFSASTGSRTGGRGS